MKTLVAVLFAAVACANPISKDQAAPVAKCGVPAIKPDTSTNIVGGKDAIPYSWPWQVSITRKRNATHFGHTCGGSLISNQWILSAAHCFGDTSLGTYQIKLGVYNQFNANEPGEKILKLSEIHVNPKYATQGPKYDSSVLKLAEPVELTDHISPVCLPTKQDEEQPTGGTGVFLTGWGKIRAGPSNDPTVPIGTNLQQLSIPLLSSEKCRSVVGANRADVLLCFGGPEQKGKSACFGDSGGPAVYQNPAKSGQFEQIGVTSFGAGAGGATCQGYSIYTKVSSSLDFIRQYVKDV